MSSCSQPTMIVDDDAPNRVFKIGELARLIASQLVLVSRNSAVNLARTCRHLEEPALSTLWKTQDSLDTLLKALPDVTWVYEYPAVGSSVVRDLDHPLKESNAQV